MREARLTVWILGGLACSLLLASCINRDSPESVTDYDQKLRKDISDGNLLEVGYDLQKGADPNGAGSTQSPLYRAIDRERPAIARLLIAHGADVNAGDDRGTTPLHYVCEWAKSPMIATVLIEAGADVNARDLVRRTPLHWVAESDASELVALLLQHGADINAKDDLGWTPLKLATIKNSTSVKDVLLKHVATE